MRAQFIDQSSGKLIHSEEDMSRADLVVGDLIHLSTSRPVAGKSKFSGTIVAVELAILADGKQDSQKELRVHLEIR